MKKQTARAAAMENTAENWKACYLREQTERVKVLDTLRDLDAKVLELERENAHLRQVTKDLHKFIEDLHCAHRLMGSLFKT